MISLVVGSVCVGLSLWGIVHWREEFVVVMKGFLPVSFLMGGLVAIIAGFSSFGGKKPAEPVEKK